MKQPLKNVILLVAITLHCVWLAEVQAQDPTWQDEASKRLRAIYDRGEFRVPDIEPRMASRQLWL